MIYYAEDKYICEDCNEVFDEYHHYCPNCDGYGVFKADLCKIKGCKEYMVDGDHCCAECKAEAKKVLVDALALLAPEQIRYLDAITEGETLLKFWRDN